MTWAEDDARELVARRRAGAPSDTTERRPLPSGDSASRPAGPGTAAGAPDIGWVLYSRWEPLDAAGIVTGIDHHQYVDPDTGEMWPETKYRLYAYWRQPNPWRWLYAVDVDPTQGGPDRALTSVAIRMLVKPLVLKRNYSKPLTPSDIEAVRAAGILVRAVAS